MSRKDICDRMMVLVDHYEYLHERLPRGLWMNARTLTRYLDCVKKRQEARGSILYVYKPPVFQGIRIHISKSLADGTISARRP